MTRIPYGKQTIEPEDIAAVERVLKSDYLTQGPAIPEFENQVAAYHNAAYGVAFSNGTAALHAAYHVLGVKEGDEVLTSPITFAATANAALYCGGTPKFVDISWESYCMDPSKLRAAISIRTKVISPVAFAGYPVDLERIRATADAAGCHIVYDAAHAIASKRNGSFGMEHIDMAILSFHPVKHITTGEGGMVLTNNPSYYKQLLLFRSHGITKDPVSLRNNHGGWYYEMQSLGYNYRMTDIQAALGFSQFSRIDDNLRSRNELAKYYTSALADCDAIITPPIAERDAAEGKSPQTLHAYHLYPIRLKDAKLRKGLYDWLHSRGVLVQVHYIPLHLQPYYADRYGYKAGDFPVAEAYYSTALSLPMYHNMCQSDAAYVVQQVIEFLETNQ